VSNGKKLKYSRFKVALNENYTRFSLHRLTQFGSLNIILNLGWYSYGDDTYNENEDDNDQDDKNMQTQINISLFDNVANESKIETHDSTPIKQQPASTGAFSMLQQKLRENASREKDLKNKQELSSPAEKRKINGGLSKLV
jgi:hypothetical protein